ncbi:MAG: hypothetical protein BGN88_08030 [Clostridiales bacterium 43-6]|nr:MAG: hypothetical protein BGN88_08030 [Clostridiales bacterium 43-6]
MYIVKVEKCSLYHLTLSATSQQLIAQRQKVNQIVIGYVRNTRISVADIDMQEKEIAAMWDTCCFHKNRML